MRPLAGVRVTLIDPGAVAPYTGMLPGYVEGLYRQEDIGIDLVRLCRFAGAAYVQGRVSAIDPEARVLRLGDREIEYDVASLDIGLTTEPGGAAEGEDTAVPVKPFARFIEGWHAYLAAGARDPIVVIGAGVGGVELALAMRRRIGPGGQVTLVGAGGIAGVGPAMRARLSRALAEAGVQLVGGRVVSVRADGLRLEDGRELPGGFVVRAGGGRGQVWPGAGGLEGVNGFVKVNNALQSVDYDNLFAVGDCAFQFQNVRSKAGVFAVRAAPVLFHNLRARLTGGALRPFRPQRRYLRLVALGGGTAAAERYERLPAVLSGRLIWQWKDRIDRRFIDRLTTLPPMPEPARPKELADGAAEIMSAAPLCAGCGAKVGAGVLTDVLTGLRQPDRPDVLTGPGDDAGILRMGEVQQVLTTDHLRGFTGDVALMARIAAQHALGDIRAMGAEPQSALAQIILPRASEPLQRRMMQQIMTAATAVFAEDGAVILGGHSTMGAELTIGFSVTGLCRGRPVTLGGARAGDVLLMTGAIGSGVLLAAEMQLKARGLDIAALLTQMARGQRRQAAHLKTARAMTDVTGFGLAGHLMAMCRASGLGAELGLADVPLYDGALDLAQGGGRSTLYSANAANAPLFGPTGPRVELMHDPQTAGGLLAAVDPADAQRIIRDMRSEGLAVAVIGRMTDGPVAITLI
ncbi:selenide, water dikinase SelD [Pseudooceanicola sp. C21-150M6]|uniref:selenide, water dikinase SelD n=1 Tax=Pseudooceanicola sp. C21-150M6 TaxID=3434355 RepID=UPI003D7F6768